MTILSIIQQVCSRKGISKPSAVMTSADPQIIQMVALANEEGQDLAMRYPWQALQNESTFTTLAAESQGAMTTLAGTGFKYVMNDIMWNRDLRRPVFGPLMPYQWQQLKAQRLTGPWNQFRIRAGNLLFIPAPAAGNTVAFEWLSKNWTTGAGGDAASWTLDADTSYLDEDLMTLGILWRWNAAKGLAYAEDKLKYEQMYADVAARDGAKPALNMNGANIGYAAGIFIPVGGY